MLRIWSRSLTGHVLSVESQQQLPGWSGRESVRCDQKKATGSQSNESSINEFTGDQADNLVTQKRSRDVVSSARCIACERSPVKTGIVAIMPWKIG